MPIADILDRCPTCERPRFGKPHRCAPAWEVRDAEEGGDEWSTVYEDRPDDAATLWVARDNSACGEYPSRRTVVVRRLGEAEKEERYEVELEVVPSYTARRVRNQEPRTENQQV